MYLPTYYCSNYLRTNPFFQKRRLRKLAITRRGDSRSSQSQQHSFFSQYLYKLEPRIWTFIIKEVNKVGISKILTLKLTFKLSKAWQCQNSWIYETNQQNSLMWVKVNHADKPPSHYRLAFKKSGGNPQGQSRPINKCSTLNIKSQL